MTDHIPFRDAVKEFKRSYLLAVLKQSKGNICEAARNSGLHRNSFSRICAEVGIDTQAVWYELNPVVRRPCEHLRGLKRKKPTLSQGNAEWQRLGS